VEKEVTWEEIGRRNDTKPLPAQILQKTGGEQGLRFWRRKNHVTQGYDEPGKGPQRITIRAAELAERRRGEDTVRKRGPKTGARSQKRWKKLAPAAEFGSDLYVWVAKKKHREEKSRGEVSHQ